MIPAEASEETPKQRKPEKQKETTSASTNHTTSAKKANSEDRTNRTVDNISSLQGDVETRYLQGKDFERGAEEAKRSCCETAVVVQQETQIAAQESERMTGTVSESENQENLKIDVIHERQMIAEKTEEMQEGVLDGEKVVTAEQLTEEEGEVDYPRVCCGVIRLQQGISCCNFLTMLLVSLMAICLLVFLNAMQGFLLTGVFGVETDELGTVSANLSLADEVWSIVTLAAWGIFSDRLGRRNIVMLGFLQISIASLIIPNGNQVFPGLLLARLLYAQGASALSSMISALLADYVHRDDLGKATGLVGLMSGLGALIAVFYLVGELPPSICIVNTYYVVASISFAMVGVTYFGLQSLEKMSEADHYAKPETENPFKLLVEGLKLAYKNRNLGLAYCAGFLARGDTVISSIFISLWVNEHFLENDICNTCLETDGEITFDLLLNCTEVEVTTCGEDIDDPDEVLCPDAYTRFRILSGISQTAGIIVAPLLGSIGDRVDPVTLVLFTAVFGSISYGLAFLLESPEDSIALIVVDRKSVV